jgi:hypothetical protein
MATGSEMLEVFCAAAPVGPRPANYRIDVVPDAQLLGRNQLGRLG